MRLQDLSNGIYTKSLQIPKIVVGRSKNQICTQIHEF